MADSETSGEIEVGASAEDGGLRYWKAKEAVRQGEARLTAQAATRTSMEARATAITGWAAASLLVATGAVSAAASWPARGGAGLAACILFAAASLSIYAARPRDWSIAGYDPPLLTGSVFQTELEVLEAIAGGIYEGMKANNMRLNGMAKLLRWAGWLLIIAPLSGAAIYLAAKLAV